MSPFVAYNLFVLFHLVVGALGTYAFSRAVGARRSAAWVAGLLAFTAAFWVHWSLHLVHLGSFVWLPWALAAGHRLVVAPSPRRVAPLAAVFGLWWLGGNPQYVYDGSAVLVVYLLGLAVLLSVRSRRHGLSCNRLAGWLPPWFSASPWLLPCSCPRWGRLATFCAPGSLAL